MTINAWSPRMEQTPPNVIDVVCEARLTFPRQLVASPLADGADLRDIKFRSLDPPRRRAEQEGVSKHLEPNLLLEDSNAAVI